MSTKSYRIILLASLFVTTPNIAHADPAGDEARRQASMERSRESAAAIDRRNSDQAFQASLTRSSSIGGGSGSSSSGSSSSSSTPSIGPSGGGGASSGPQSVVSTRIVRVWVGETVAQTAQRLSREAAAGNAQSQYDLGRMYYAGLGVATNLTEARRLFVAAANQGHIEGAAYAGQFLVYGRGGPVDTARGMAFLHTAAQGGNTDAKSVLGIRIMATAFATGDNTEMPVAIRYLEQAAEAGNAVAQAALGTTIYYYGVGGVPADGVKAVRYLRMGADQGHPMSMYHLGNLMVNGDPWTGENQSEGWALINRAAQAGDGRALWRLAAAKFGGTSGQTKDLPEAVRLMRLSAEAGDRNGQHGWGQMLYFGVGVAENKPEGLRYTRLAADAFYPEAQYDMALANYFGDVGIPKSLDEAARWARLSAENGLPRAELLFSKLLWAGEGVAQDRVQAVRWMKKAADHGDETAKNDLKDPEVAAILRTL